MCRPRRKVWKFRMCKKKTNKLEPEDMKKMTKKKPNENEAVNSGNKLSCSYRRNWLWIKVWWTELRHRSVAIEPNGICITHNDAPISAIPQSSFFCCNQIVTAQEWYSNSKHFFLDSNFFSNKFCRIFQLEVFG